MSNMDDFNKLDFMFENIIQTIPEKKKELLEKVGDKLEKQVKENIIERVDGANEGSNLVKGVEKVFGSKNGYVAVKPNYNVAPHSHLVENGHRIVRNDVNIGHTNGKHMYRDSIQQCEDEIIKLAFEMIDEVIGND